VFVLPFVAVALVGISAAPIYLRLPKDAGAALAGRHPRG
jgi:hypothetical protein